MLASAHTFRTKITTYLEKPIKIKSVDSTLNRVNKNQRSKLVFGVWCLSMAKQFKSKKKSKKSLSKKKFCCDHFFHSNLLEWHSPYFHSPEPPLEPVEILSKHNENYVGIWFLRLKRSLLEFWNWLKFGIFWVYSGNS